MENLNNTKKSSENHRKMAQKTKKFFMLRNYPKYLESSEMRKNYSKHNNFGLDWELRSEAQKLEKM